MDEKQKHRCELIFEFDTAEKARTVAEAVKQDNPEFVEIELNANVFKSIITASTIGSMIHTLDDYFACIALAEKLIEK